MIILGIDPGSLCTGYGFVRSDGERTVYVACGSIRTDSSLDHPDRLKHIYDRMKELIAELPPDACAVEMPVYGRNPQSMLKLGRAQAAVMLAALNADISVRQYSPKEIKKAVTGNGNASKEQVLKSVCSLLRIDRENARMGTDASDALAVALCHSHRGGRPARKALRGSWAAFLRANPDRLKA